MEQIYDILIIGGGVAGMSAGIYAKRRNKNVAIIEKFSLGGLILTLGSIKNFPSQSDVEGLTLAKMFKEQVKGLEIPILKDDVVKVDFSSEIKVLYGKKDVYRSKSVIIASGIKPIELENAPKNLNGLSYCAVCDGQFYKDKNVFVASKNGSGVKDALYLSGVAKNVTLLDCEDMSVYANTNKVDNLKVLSNVKILEVLGKEKFEGVVLGNGTLCGDALFIGLGKRPSTKIFEGVLDLDSKGYIKTDEHMHTSVQGVYAVGDVRNGSLKQIVTACADGAIAGNFA
ncbi:MAG: NAD(P)/FAD-dependent oxidoreductase [Candidatus Caccovivens sp.]